jgi:2-dehydro-3-deoxyphosphooctonate aldolase (KDO 8-P synthase)
MPESPIVIESRGGAVATFRVGDYLVGDASLPPVLLGGTCVVESRDHTMRIAEHLVGVAQRVGVRLIYKASFDKANRSSITSYRGPGMEEGLAVLAEVKATFGVPIVTDIHEPWQCAQVAEVADLLQVPAFLARQTDLLIAAGATGRPVNVKKAQYMAPEDVTNIAKKLTDSGAAGAMFTDRGTFFGYRALVNDFRALAIMRAAGFPVCFDATHSVQSMGGL